MSDGMNYAPTAHIERACKPGEFHVGVVGLEHGHIYGMCGGLQEAGADIAMVYDKDPQKIAKFRASFPEAIAVAHEEQVLENPRIKLIATADVPAERGPLGIRAMDAGKDFFTDKAPFTTAAQLEAARAKTAETGLIWAVCYSERLQNEAGVFAGELIERGAIGRVLQVIGMGPHRLNAPSRPEWFWSKERTGGILTDIGSHQIEQFLYYVGAKDAEITGARVDNFAHGEYTEFEDFGEANLKADNGASGYFRIDWFTPDGLRTWGDGRTFILGTEGYIELRKYVDVGREGGGNQVYLVNDDGEKHIPVSGKVGFPYFTSLIRDCIERTDKAMSQEHTFKAAELCLEAQEIADRARR